MKYRIPFYYKDFTCINSVCEDTCCGGWKIAIDADTMKRYLLTPGDFGKRLRRGIDVIGGCFRLKDRRCTFLNQNGLCEIQRRMGAAGLCRDCRNYPRHMEDYGDVRELMLSLSCPEAARVILSDPFQGACREVLREKQGVPEAALPWMEDARKAMICMMKDRTISWDQRLAMVLAFAHDLQCRIDECREEQMPEAVRMLTRRYLASHAAARFSEKLAAYQDRAAERRIRINAWMRSLQRLEPVLEGWQEMVGSVCTVLYHGIDEEVYESTQRMFDREAAQFEQEWENLALYFLQTYFLGAIYDYNAFDKAKMMIFSCMVIREMCVLGCLNAQKVTKEQLVEAAYRYSREVENSDNNLTMLEELFENSRLYNLDSMLVVLCGCAAAAAD